jgi:hypothetical protein
MWHMEASRRTTPQPHPLDDPEARKAQQARLRALADELEAEMSDADRARCEKHYAELKARAATWPE